MNGLTEVEEALGGEVIEPSVIVLDESDPLDLATWDKIDDMVADHGDNVIITFRGVEALAE